MKADPAFCPHVRKDDFQCTREPGHGAEPPHHIDRDGVTWPMHLPMQPPKAKVDPITEQEAEEIDFWMSEHMNGHAISNHPLSMGCDIQCRTDALRRGINKVLEAR